MDKCLCHQGTGALFLAQQSPATGSFWLVGWRLSIIGFDFAPFGVQLCCRGSYFWVKDMRRTSQMRVKRLCGRGSRNPIVFSSNRHQDLNVACGRNSRLHAPANEIRADRTDQFDGRLWWWECFGGYRPNAVSHLLRHHHTLATLRATRKKNPHRRRGCPPQENALLTFPRTLRLDSEAFVCRRKWGSHLLSL